MPFFDGLSGWAVASNIDAQKAGLQQTCRCQTAAFWQSAADFVFIFGPALKPVAHSMTKKILVIDDDYICRQVAAAGLRSMGFTDVTCAVDGHDGLNLYDQMEPAPDFVICDVFMPRKDGIEVASGLVARKFSGGLILMSGGNSDIISMMKSLAIGGGLNVLGVLLKPLDLQELALAMRSPPNAE
jgi:CheY-like chemotaxis protein